MKKLFLLLILFGLSSHFTADAQKKHKTASSIPPINISGKLFGGVFGFSKTEPAHWIELDFGDQTYTLDIFEDCYKGSYKTKGNVVTIFTDARGEMGKLYFQTGGKTLTANMKGNDELQMWIVEWPRNLTKFDVPEEEIIEQIVKNDTYDCIMIMFAKGGNLGVKGTVKFTDDKSYWNFPYSYMDGKYDKEQNYEISGSTIEFEKGSGTVYNNGNFIEINNGEGWFPSLGKVKTLTYLIK